MISVKAPRKGPNFRYSRQNQDNQKTQKLQLNSSSSNCQQSNVTAYAISASIAPSRLKSADQVAHDKVGFQAQHVYAAAVWESGSETL